MVQTSESIPAGLPLIALDEFHPVINVLAGKKIWYVPGPGNPGDMFVHAGAACLFRKIKTCSIARSQRPDFLVWGGGGNLGTLYPTASKQRTLAFELARQQRIPIVIMPQSATNAEEQLPEDAIVFARERRTQEVYPHSILAPDTALAFDEDVQVYKNPQFNVGIFLRTDKETRGEINPALSVGDPVNFCIDYRDYLRLAGCCETIVTDRLHLAIVSLIVSQRTILLPNSYYKNRAVYEAWLQRLGCMWGPEAMEKALTMHDCRPEEIRRYCESFRRSKLQAKMKTTEKVFSILPWYLDRKQKKLRAEHQRMSEEIVRKIQDGGIS